MPFYELIPWWMVAVSLFFAGVGGWGFWMWRNSDPVDRARHRRWVYNARALFVAHSLLAVAALCVTVYMTLKNYRRLDELAQVVAPYPGAMPEVSLLTDDRGMWMLETPDSPGKVRAFYIGLADREKVPFRQVRDSDTRFVFGQGTNAVLLDLDDQRGDTTITYQVPAGPQAF